MTTDTARGAISQRLMGLLEEATEGTVRADARDTGPGSIRGLGVSSVAMLEFLVAIEDEFGIEWEDDVEESVLDSLDSITAHIIAERGQ